MASGARTGTPSRADLRRVLAHYYTGTTLGGAVTKVRGSVTQGQRRLTIASEAPFGVRDGIGQLWHLARARRPSARAS